MSDISKTLVARVQNSFAQLSAVATKLNTVSGELSRVVSELDAALQKLNLGISAWIDVSRESHGDGYHSLRKMGYARVGKQWGIALCVVNTHEFADVDERPDVWLFNDAPRWLRIEGVERLPELFEKLSAEAEATTERLVVKTAQAKELASAVNPRGAINIGQLAQGFAKGASILTLVGDVDNVNKPVEKYATLATLAGLPTDEKTSIGKMMRQAPRPKQQDR